MNTRIVPVSPSHLDQTPIAEAAELICRGELVAMPTETVYGLAGDALNPVAVQAIFVAKGRPSSDPLRNSRRLRVIYRHHSTCWLIHFGQAHSPLFCPSILNSIL
ncbi:MAG: hypothetical protein RI985_1959 [Chloroflexota bacterium]|jgi:hypothetical protein